MSKLKSGGYTLPKNVSHRFFICKFWNDQRQQGKANYLMIKINYTAPKKLLPNFHNSQMKKRGETLFGKCKNIMVVVFFFHFWQAHVVAIGRKGKAYNQVTVAMMIYLIECRVYRPVIIYERVVAESNGFYKKWFCGLELNITRTNSVPTHIAHTYFFYRSWCNRTSRIGQTFASHGHGPFSDKKRWSRWPAPFTKY